MVTEAAQAAHPRPAAGPSPAVVELVPERADPAPFLEVESLVYRGDPRYCPPPRGSVEAGLRRAAFAGRQRAFLAPREGAPAARVVARLHPELRDGDGRPVGLLGFFESLDAAEPARAVLDAGVAWLRSRGAGRVVGPMDGDTWHRYRLNAGPFAEPPFLLEPYNPPYYEALWLAAGFQPLASYSSLRVDDPARAAAALHGTAERALAAGYRLEPVERRHFAAALDRIYDLTVASFHRNLLYTEISRADFHRLYGASGGLVDPRLVWIARAPGQGVRGGADAGFVFAYPDRFRAVQAMGGRRDAVGKLRYLVHRITHPGGAAAFNVKTLGVLPEHRRSGVAAALMVRVYEGGLAAGLDRANLCLILDGNPSATLDGGAGRPLRRYRLYEHGSAAGPPPGDGP